MRRFSAAENRPRSRPSSQSRPFIRFGCRFELTSVSSSSIGLWAPIVGSLAGVADQGLRIVGPARCAPFGETNGAHLDFTPPVGRAAEAMLLNRRLFDLGRPE